MAGELGVLYLSLTYWAAHPNKWSFPPYFRMYYFTMVVMAFYAYGLPVMYTFMLKQRRKQLGGGGGSKKKVKSKKQ